MCGEVVRDIAYVWLSDYWCLWRSGLCVIV